MCLFPWSASLDPEGGRPRADKEGELLLPCGKCTECLKKRSFEWGTRARHEISLHEENCFITLTYDDEHLQSDFCLKKPFQNFMKKIRKKAKKKLSVLVSHEYGTKKFRPHHHAIIFGWTPSNQKYLRSAPSGNALFTSEDIAKEWKHGYHSIGEANEKTAYYIASYALKGKKHDIITDTGEYFTGIDTFDSSKRPAIGLMYFIDNIGQIVTSGDMTQYYEKILNNGLPKYLKDPDSKYFIGYEKLLEFDSKRKQLISFYEEKKMENLKKRSCQEKLAKLTIDQSKNLTNDSEFRTAPENLELKQQRRYLKLGVEQYDQGLRNEKTLHSQRP